MKKILALVLAMMMVLALCACGAKEEAAPAEVAPAVEAAPAEAAPAVEEAAPAEGEAAPAEGTASGEPTGEPVAELYPADGYSKDFEGYKAYAIDALKSDPSAPADIVDMTVAAFEAATDGSAADFEMMINQGRILSYDEFING